MPAIDTPRLRLRRLDAERDAAAMLELLNEPAFLRGIGDRGVRTREQSRDFLHVWAEAHHARHGFSHYAVETREGGVFLGTAGLLRREALPAPDIGYALLSRHHGHGHAEEAARAVLAHARDVLALPRVLAIASQDNARSLRLLEKIGLHRAGEHVMRDGEAPLALYAIDFPQGAVRHPQPR